MKHFGIKLSEDEYTRAKRIGLWELEQELKPLFLEILASMEHNNGNRKQY